MYKISIPNTLYILFFLETDIGIIRKTHIVKKINAAILNFVNENTIRNINNDGKPTYKSCISMYFPNVFFTLRIVIYKLSSPSMPSHSCWKNGIYCRI